MNPNIIPEVENNVATIVNELLQITEETGQPWFTLGDLKTIRNIGDTKALQLYSDLAIRGYLSEKTDSKGNMFIRLAIDIPTRIKNIKNRRNVINEAIAMRKKDIKDYAQLVLFSINLQEQLRRQK